MPVATEEEEPRLEKRPKTSENVTVLLHTQALHLWIYKLLEGERIMVMNTCQSVVSGSSRETASSPIPCLEEEGREHLVSIDDLFLASL
jgi:hypothetical protein